MEYISHPCLLHNCLGGTKNCILLTLSLMMIFSICASSIRIIERG
jgi:hypothetical protein